MQRPVLSVMTVARSFDQLRLNRMNRFGSVLFSRLSQMNIVIGIAILLTLMLSDSPFAPGEINVGFRVCGLVLLTAIAPFTATLLVFLTERKPSDERSLHSEVATARINSSIHTVIWLISSLAIVTALGWQDVVRQTLNLKSWILLDEALIVAPMLISLIVSWAIFFEQQSHSINPIRRRVAMFKYVGLRCKVYLLMVLIPIILVVLLKDLWPYLSELSPAFAGLVCICSLIALLSLMPVAIRFIWSNRPITENEGRAGLLALCDAHKVGVNDIRVWDTSHQIVNALVAGIIPKFRVLMVTDLLLRTFPQHELKAIILHEAGHVRLRHLPTRIGFILLPALALLAMEMDPNGSMNAWFSQVGVTKVAGLLMGLTFFAYVIGVTAWLSRNMEFEADLYAVGAFNKDINTSDSRELANAMADALLRFAEQNPDQYSRRSTTHPSLLERIEVIKKFVTDQASASKFQAQFQTQQFLLAFGMLVVMIGLIVV